MRRRGRLGERRDLSLRFGKLMERKRGRERARRQLFDGLSRQRGMRRDLLGQLNCLFQLLIQAFDLFWCHR